MTSKIKLIDLLGESIAVEQDFAGRLSDAEREAEGTFEHWSARDVLAHIAAWKENMVAGLEAVLRGEATAWDADEDQANAEIYTQHQRQTWDETLTELQNADKRLLERVEKIAEDDLLNPDLDPRRNHQPAWASVAGNGFTHAIIHIAQYAIDHGDPARGTQLNEMAARRLLELDDSPAWRGTALYNLACSYSLSGRTEEAIRQLEEALRLNPELQDWSRQDPDFIPLHGNPQYQALVG